MKVDRLTILGNIPFASDLERLQSKLHIKPGSELDRDLQGLCARARTLAAPKAIYRNSYIEMRDEGSIVLDGVRLHSRVLQVNLSELHRVFPYIATCGSELAEWARGIEGLMQQYMADLIMESALDQAIAAMEADIQHRFSPGDLSEMNPGSLPDWPIEQQRPLFALLGDAPEAIDVRLKDSLLMSPTKTVSGIKFASERSFASCMLCDREGCRGRAAEYDPDLFAREYAP